MVQYYSLSKNWDFSNVRLYSSVQTYEDQFTDTRNRILSMRTGSADSERGATGSYEHGNEL
jgi:hypothetical protein